MSHDTSTFKCEVVVPDGSAQLHDVISRWSDGGVDVPALVVRPQTESDIVDAITYAKQHGLRLIPANGGHATFVPIDSKTLYLDMNNFNEVALDSSAQVVRIGGGASVRHVVSTLTPKGFYTVWPNSNAVGYVGALLGGGSHSLNGVHGLMVDSVISFRLITASGNLLTVSAASSGEELKLFHALRGAGPGLGVVVSVTMKAFRISDLNLTDDKVWLRTLVFPPTAIDAAAEAFEQLQPPSARLLAVLLFVRSPPGSPNPGAPIVMLNAVYHGPSSEAEALASPLFDARVLANTVKAESRSIPIANVNDSFEPFNVHGGYKDCAQCFLKSLSRENIKAGYQKWLEATGAHEDAKKSFCVIGCYNTEQLVRNGKAEGPNSSFFASRDRGISVLSFLWSESPATRKALLDSSDSFVSELRRGATDPPRSFQNAMRPGLDLHEVYGDAIPELKRVKGVWDPAGLFWSPYAG
ncbi:hypothetical protein VTK73DRAFT_7087 [Phialemonium thermophilum]|uniref:FAD-binding PCMH-type domain-containing protein n=1 Tax=Phialemonium thermophilum TaxID=223376 RepID=A0ABR3XUF5_9PEZI